MQKTTFIKSTIIVLFMVMAVSCGNQSTKESRENTQEKRVPQEGFILHFEEYALDFGVIDTTRDDNEFLSKEFVFINHNDKPIVILRATVSSCCLSVEIPRQPILSGEKGVVKITLDTRHINGRFSRSIFVTSNADNNVEVLRATGTVNR